MENQYLGNKIMRKFQNKKLILAFLVIIIASFSAFMPHESIDGDLIKTGEKAPQFELPTANGSTVKLSDYKGKIVILDFWYIGCKPCAKAYKIIQEIKQEFGEDRFVVIGMNKFNRKRKVRRYIDKGKYKDIVTFCSRGVSTEYKVKYYPSIYVIDQNGKIVFANAGLSVNFKEDLKSCLAKNMHRELIFENKPELRQASPSKSSKQKPDY